MQLTGIADIHLHTTHSDGTATVAQMLERAAEARVQVVAVTDHDTVAGALEARRMASQFGVDVIVGEEISTQEGHLLALFIDSYIAPRQSAATTIAAVHAQGGLCIAPHPYDWAVVSLGRYGLRERCATDWPFDAIEVFNASLAWPRHRCNARALAVATALGLPAVGGSDAHSSATLGAGFTCFAGSTAGDLYHAIGTGEVAYGGQSWSLAQYADITLRSVRQRRLYGAVKLACTDLPFLSRPTGQQRALFKPAISGPGGPARIAEQFQL
jgi:predicted metal-dependent phosphoesterase TrpH